MLVLSRNKGERVILTCPGGVKVTVTFIRYNGRSILLGFDAPEDCIISREELEGVSDDVA